MSVPVPPCLRASSLATIRADLEAEDPRRRLAAINELSRCIDASKPNQHAVGAFLRDATSDKRLLEIVIADLQANDRTLRCAAARLICQLAYENLVNQESIVQCTRNGFSIGWIHIFSVPQAYHTACATQPNAKTPQNQRSLAGFLRDIVNDAYEDVYTQVSAYYANGCQSFVPICWSHPRSLNSNDEANNNHVPDPEDHILGFYLVPRQTQFPEIDDFYGDDLLKSMDKQDLIRLQSLKNSFEEYTNARAAGTYTDDFAMFISSRKEPMRWFHDEPAEVVASCRDYFSQPPAAATFTTAASWSQIFVYACVRLNSGKLAATYDVGTLVSVAKLFRDLAWTEQEHISSSSNVWLPVLVAAVQHEPDLPVSFKKLIQTLQRGLPHIGSREEPWRVLLHTKLEQVVSISWAVFLAQWRIALEVEAQLRLQQQQQVPVRRTSVCSVGDLRRSIVGQLQSHSVRDLNQMRCELRKTSRFVSQQDLKSTFLPLHERTTVPVKSAEAQGDTSSEEEGDDPLARNMALFHRMQRSLAELDELGMKDLEHKRKEKSRILESVAMNKQRAQDEANRKRLQVEDKNREIEEIRVEIERRKIQAKIKAHELHQSKQALATQRKQEHDAELEEKQKELVHKIAERDRIQEHNLRLRQRQQKHERQTKSQPRTISNVEHPQAPVPPRAPTPSSKRPLSARGPRASEPKSAAERPSPEILRQRALLYGQVVSKIYVADAMNRTPQQAEERVIHQPHQLTRSFSVFQDGSFNVKAPIVKVTPPPTRRPRSPHHRRSQRGREATTESEAEVGPIEQEDQSNEGEEEEAYESPSRRSRKVKPVTSPEESKKAATSFNFANDGSKSPSNACATLVMRNAALAVSERIQIPEIPAPHVEEPSVPPYIIAAQYQALDDHYKQNFRERFNLKCVSHRLSYDVLKQYTKIVRRDMAWRAFHDKCSGSFERVKYMDFAVVAQSLGVALSEKKLLIVARQLDSKKSGYVEWKAFYTWWIMQYSDAASVTPTRPKTAR